MKGCRAREVQLPGTVGESPTYSQTRQVEVGVGEHQPCGRLVLATFSSHLRGPYCGHCPRTGPLASTRTRGVRTSFSCPARSWEEFCLPNDSEKQTSTGMLRIRAAPPQNQIDAIPFTSDVGVHFLAPGRLGQLSVPSGQGETTFPWSLLHPISPLGPPQINLEKFKMLFSLIKEVPGLLKTHWAACPFCQHLR